MSREGLDVTKKVDRSAAVISPAENRVLEAKSTMEIMTVKELAAYLRVGPNTIYRMVKRRQLPVFFVGGGQRFERTAVDQWISSRVNETARKEG
jgi:excisionase family DNA binding protein